MQSKKVNCQQTDCAHRATSYVTAYYVDGSMNCGLFLCETHAIATEIERREYGYRVSRTYRGSSGWLRSEV
jgi:hypothetical protein